MLTAEQHKAVTTPDNNVVVAAGAGSGKTRVLTRRYVHLLQAGVRPDQIVTITFTDAAAAEMRDRIARLLLELGEGRFLRDVEAGYVSTIHAFCLRLLKEYALDVDLNPNARLLTDVEAARYRVKRREEMLASYPEMPQLVERYTPATIFHGVFGLVQHGREHGLSSDTLVDAYAPDADRFAEILRKACDDRALRLQTWLLDRIESLADVAVLPNSDAASARDHAVAMAASLPRDRLLSRGYLQDEVRRTLERWPSDGGSALETARRSLLTETTKARGFWDWFDPDLRTDMDFAEHRRLMLEVARREWEVFDAYRRDEGFVDFLDMLTHARDLITRFPERFRDRFKHVLVDEFQDTNPLQTQIVQALTQGRNTFFVGDARQSIYRFRQADVAVFRDAERRARAGAIGSARLPLSYNFRSVPPILRFVEDLFRDMWSTDADADLAADPLRTGRDLLDEAREGGLLSPEELPAPSTGEPLPADPLDVAKVLDTSIDGPRVELFLFDPSNNPLTANQPKGPDGEPTRPSHMQRREAVALEADQLARRIVHLVEVERPRIYDPATTTYRPLRYGDVALLLVTRTYQETFEVMLEGYRVPYQSLGGRSFYSRMEVGDLVNALAITTNPLLDIEMAAVWRSPLVGLSDDGMFWLAKMMEAETGEPLADDVGDDEDEAPRVRSRRRTRRLFEALDLPREQLVERLDAEDVRRFEAFRDLFGRIRAQRPTLSSADTLRAWIEGTGLRTSLQTERRNALQALANIDKLVQLAREFDDDGRQPMESFVQALQECREAEVSETDAAPSPEPGEGNPDAVRIMTVHASKGLEFPVVFVPDLGRQLRVLPAVRDETGKTLRNAWHTSELFGAVANYVPESGKDPRPTLARELTKAAEMDAERDEAKRLLYVACTRARELLYLSGSCDHRKLPEAYDSARNAASWLRRFVETRCESEGPDESIQVPNPTGEAGMPPAEMLRFGDGPFARIRRWSQVPEPPVLGEPKTYAEYVDSAIRDDIELPWPAAFGPELPHYTSAVEDHVRTILGPPGSTAADELFAFADTTPPEKPVVPATGLATYMQCPTRYYLTQVLAIDDHIRAHAPDPLAASEEVAEQIDAEYASLTSRRDAGRGEEGIDPEDLATDQAARHIGTYVHNVLDLLRLGRFIPGSDPSQVDQRLARIDEEIANADVPADLREPVRGMVQTMLDGPIGSALQKATAVEQEVPFWLDLREGIVTGSIDLLYRHRDEWIVVDYKTSAVKTQAEQAAEVELYREQMELYALAVATRYRVSKVTLALAFLRPGTEARWVLQADDLERVRAAATDALHGIRNRRYAAPDGGCPVCRAKWNRPADPCAAVTSAAAAE